MMYHEFLELLKATPSDVTYEQYKDEIEPCYMFSAPEMFKDKQEFIKWWKKNKGICKFISITLNSLEASQKEVSDLKQKLKNEEDLHHVCERRCSMLMQEKEAIQEEKEMLEQEIGYVREVKNKVDDENEKLFVALEKKNEKYDDLMSEALNDRSNLLDKIQELMLKIAFTPEKVTREIRNEFFDTYDEKKQDALKRGIITE